MVAPRRSEEFAAVREDMVGEGQMGLVAKDQGEMLRSVHDVVPAETGDCGDAGGPLHSSMNGDTMTICVAGVWQCSRAGGEPPVAPAVATSESSPPLDNGALNSHNSKPVTSAILFYSVQQPPHITI